MKSLTEILIQHRSSYFKIIPFRIEKSDYHLFDFTEGNEILQAIDLNKQEEFSGYIFDSIRTNNKEYGIGKYNEDRIIYKRSQMFSDDEPRSVHLGIDIWADAGTPIYCPLDGVIHSFANNRKHGDYGPTIILEHELEHKKFHTLYGHLSKESIKNLSVGQSVDSGNLFAHFGNYNENVHWPPHLHFQIIENMQNYKGDFPGVCKPSEKEFFLANCPNPNLILNIEGI